MQGPCSESDGHVLFGHPNGCKTLCTHQSLEIRLELLPVAFLRMDQIKCLDLTVEH
ncbi:hypothetical protein BDA96_09G075800 [Sorghum bicolor]|uniref:Uncharacterized protein n=2 Tax=Sorghum bicolor TaxID=4558 RepID=A0A921Q8W8_SORBI|nr:hypothetical protein BDA96_09G075800 [Sorghum bicolor]OQU77587.1 hypothetical protein SORBI_3009G072033 [Sorghum bicolor]